MQMISQLLQQILFIYVKLCWEGAGFDLGNSLMSLQNNNQNMVYSSDSDHGSSGCDSNHASFEIQTPCVGTQRWIVGKLVRLF